MSPASRPTRTSAARPTSRRALDALKRAANSERENVYERIVEAAEVGVTHGEIVEPACARSSALGIPLSLSEAAARAQTAGEPSDIVDKLMRRRSGGAGAMHQR